MAELEKLTVNLGPVDLGQIELLVEQGFYANRAEFIRSAIQNQLAKHGDTVREATTRNAYLMGALSYGRKALEEERREGRRLKLHLVGYLSIADDVTPDLAQATIESLKVLGIFKASPEVKAALADRTH
jgi:Arc/MetJ-type ribon-helix-helix transcriptional regulator